jgi:hypothetical protein
VIASRRAAGRGGAEPQRRGRAADEAPLLTQLGAAHCQGVQVDPLVCRRCGWPSILGSNALQATLDLPWFIGARQSRS